MTQEPIERCLHPVCSALPWLKRPSALGMWWAFWEGKYSLWQVIKIPAGWMAMNDEIGNSMVGWINSANPEKCELEGSIWFPALCASAENGSDTPDFILAAYLTDCLAAYDRALVAREKWYGRQCGGLKGPIPVDGPPPPDSAND